MKLNNELTRRQTAAYDRTLLQIRDQLGSYHTIALQIFRNCDREVTSETVRAWFAERRIPTHIVFALYEICSKSFDPLTLVPWLGSFVELKS
jgi:hypothetical protein